MSHTVSWLGLDTVGMQTSPQKLAEDAAFSSFANGYLREIDPGIRVHHALSDGPPASCIEWTLRRQRVAVRAEISLPSLCGAKRFGQIWTRHLHEPRWRPTTPLDAIPTLIREAYASNDRGPDDTVRERELELLTRVLDSYRETARHIAIALRDDSEDTSFIGAERSLVFGHWLHPTPKSRQGLTTWQARAYAPEEAGTFQLTVFAVDAAAVRQGSIASRPAPEIALELLGVDATMLPLEAHEIAVPMHPLQAEALMLEPHVEAMMRAGDLRPLGAFGRRFTATSSLRTVYAEDSRWMAKFSLPVTLTNSLRVNRFAELRAGVAMARLIARSGFAKRHPAFHILADPAYLALRCEDREESGFETVFRENPFRDGAERGIATLAALTAEPLPGRPSRLEALLRGLTPGGGDLAGTARRWFARYLDCMLEPVVALYEEHGIALEAHQQNALLDVAAGWPQRGFYRDNQGFYLSETFRPDLLHLAPETASIPSLYFEDAEIRRRLAYYLVVNQIFSVVARMGHDGVIGEAVLVADLAARLEAMAQRMIGTGRAFVRSVLDGATLCTKANLRIRLAGRDELDAGANAGLYIDMPNPLAPFAAGRYETPRAAAS